MTIPHRTPDPIEVAWVLEVRRGHASVIVRPDHIYRMRSQAERGHVLVVQPQGIVALTESEVTSLAAFAQVTS